MIKQNPTLHTREWDYNTNIDELATQCLTYGLRTHVLPISQGFCWHRFGTDVALLKKGFLMS